MSPAGRAEPAPPPGAGLFGDGPAREALRLLAGPGGGEIGGVAGALLSVLVHGHLLGDGPPLLVLLPGAEEPEAVLEDLAILGGPAGRAHLYPAGFGAGAVRAMAIRDWRKSGGALVAAARTAVEDVPDPRSLELQSLRLRAGLAGARDHLLVRCAEAGLVRDAQVVEPGRFSVRGDVVDLWPPGAPEPLRVEFRDEDLDELRIFDPETQLSRRRLDEAVVHLPPVSSVAHGVLADHLQEGDRILLHEPAASESALEHHLLRLDEAARGPLRAAFASLLRSGSVRTWRMPRPAPALDLDGRPVAAEGSGFTSALATLDRVTAGKRRVLLAFDSQAEEQRFREHLRARPGGAARMDAIVTARGRVSSGFHSPALGLALLSYCELFALPRERRAPGEAAPVRGGPAAGRPIDSFLDLEPGDFVVHAAHGIARFEGLERQERGGFAQDFLALRFADDVRLLVPAAKIDLVQKYVGGRGASPEPSRLGGAVWGRRKAAVARAVTEFAAGLIELQAHRAARPGLSHPPDTPWQQEFEAALPFTLTEDQAQAVEDIKRDLEAPRPMDRLLCGDVGYGKTEVAMRAAFKVVMGGRQVAVLVPTTVLAQQHYETFRSRMKDYPVIVEVLSRFRSPGEQARVVAEAAEGRVDVLIGTHRLLQKDVAFQDLGLLVIDEEQRFGVADKERLRRLRREVDVLTLTATPIPRTLHQAMVGIRDISSLTQAPRGRQQIRTEVVADSPEVIRAAIRRELDRQGQVFFVHNRVQTIHDVARRIASIVPEARIQVAHGQMQERALEMAMLRFLRHEADLLLCTTIIESGLDIPRANTLFVDDADRYGLSELHQLRGRVGRGHNQAYAYFIVPPDRLVSEVAGRRLRAIEEFARLGAGFQIAMRDLEIRGAGNILGTEQSGHIAAVGYEMYCRLLDRAARRLRREPEPPLLETEINIDFTAYLPESWIQDRRQRIEAYRRLGRARTAQDLAALAAELTDRFGAPPGAAGSFLEVAAIRALLERHRVARISTAPGYGFLLTPHSMEALKAHLGRSASEVRVVEGRHLLLVPRGPIRGPGELLRYLQGLFGEGVPPGTCADRVRP
jgi:transcription-repair coupling factor (superfamily II helicase)